MFQRNVATINQACSSTPFALSTAHQAFTTVEDKPIFHSRAKITRSAAASTGRQASVLSIRRWSNFGISLTQRGLSAISAGAPATTLVRHGGVTSMPPANQAVGYGRVQWG